MTPSNTSARRKPWHPLLGHWTRRSPASSTHHVLRQGNIYVLPSAAGWALALTLLILLVASINFQLNLGYALTFLIAGSALASLWLGHRNMRGVELRLNAVPAIFQGERAALPVVLQTIQGSHHRYSLSLAVQNTHGQTAWAHTDVPAGQTASVELGVVPALRGWHAVPRLVVESRYPLGVFRLWSYWQPDSRILVYPAPESPMPPIRQRDAVDALPHGQRSLTRSNAGEHDGVRSYQRGDALRTIVWKKTATSWASGSGDMVVRNHAAPPRNSVWLTALATGLRDPEAQIARLTAWVLHADAQQWQWGLQLPSGHCIAPSSGAQHLQDCLLALAVDGVPAST